MKNGTATRKIQARFQKLIKRIPEPIRGALAGMPIVCTLGTMAVSESIANGRSTRVSCLLSLAGGDALVANARLIAVSKGLLREDNPQNQLDLNRRLALVITFMRIMARSLAAVASPMNRNRK